MLPAIKNPDAVWIAGDLYLKSPEALEAAFNSLRELGYKIAPDSDCDWLARPTNVRKAKCNSCGANMQLSDAWRHGNKCRNCGEITYREIADGSTVRFTFRADDGPQLQMKARAWDTDNGVLYLYPELLTSTASERVLCGNRARMYLNGNSDRWNTAEQNGQTCLAVKYNHAADDNILALQISSCVNFRITNNTPLSAFAIYEAWRWMPLPTAPDLPKRIIQAARQVPCADWYYAEDPEWPAQALIEMGKFIRHFTSLDADDWDELSGDFRLDGPGAIEDITKFCCP